MLRHVWQIQVYWLMRVKQVEMPSILLNIIYKI